VNAPTWNLCRSFAGRMQSDPAQRSLMSRPARRVCCAVKTYRSHGAVRGCALLATDSQQRPSVAGQAFRGQSVVAVTLCLRNVCFTDSNHSTLRLWRLPGSPSDNLCTWYTITRLPRATGSRMIVPYQSSTLRDMPFRLYGSRRAVKVLRAALWSTVDCACSAAGPARMASRWSNHRQKIFET
jgi:hypothetical protein